MTMIVRTALHFAPACLGNLPLIAATVGQFQPGRPMSRPHMEQTCH